MTGRTKSELEAWWVLRAQTGDQEALNELLKTVQEPLYRYIFSLVREQHLAEDILQEVFIRIYRKLGWLREPQVFRAWAYQIATRETFRHLARERRWREQVGDEFDLKMVPSPPPREEFAPELIERLPELIAHLSPASRAVIVLYYLHGMSFDETAAVLSVPIGTVKSRLAYGLENLRRQFRKRDRLLIGGHDAGAEQR
jgi:RNA polymerase sigma-70 factor (ECF subfamily)